MKYSLRLLVMAVVVGLISFSVGCEADSAGCQWKPLFNGKNLAMFEKRGGEAVYSIEDGAIVGRSKPGDKQNTFLCTKKRYGDFELELETKVDPSLNSGIQIRSNSLAEYRDYRVHGYQVEIDPSARAWSGGIYDEARRGWLNDLKENEAGRKAFKNNQWNKYRVVCVGDSLKTWINGVPCADLVDSMTLDGFIALQVHTNSQKTPMPVAWRNIRIKDMGCHSWVPLFDGETLNGWHKYGGGQWSVKNGAITGTSSESEENHGLLVSDKAYDDFTVRLKFLADKGNSGFYFRIKLVDGSAGCVGFQAEIDPANDVGGLYETNGRAWVVKPSAEEVEKYFKANKWNQMTVSAHGGRIVVHVNNYKTAELKDDPSARSGYLALQLHARQDMNVSFKDIEILMPDSKNCSEK